MDAQLAAGRFVLPADGSSPWWSDEVYLVLGMSPGDVQPSMDAFLRHVCAEQRHALVRALDACAEHARPFAGLFAAKDLGGCSRTVAVAGVPSGAEHAGRRAVDGTVVDLTPVVEDEAAAAVNLCVPAELDSRAAVEQAVGCLMLVHGIDREAALVMVRRGAERCRTEIPDEARRVMAAAVRLGGAPGADRRRLDEVIGAVVDRIAGAPA